MAKLTPAKRRALPDSAFALPQERKYPVKKIVAGKLQPDPAHAANAKSRAAQFAPPAEKAVIDRKADAILGKKSGPNKPAPSKTRQATTPRKGKR